MFPRPQSGPGPGLCPQGRRRLHEHRQGGPLPRPGGKLLRQAQGSVQGHHRTGDTSSERKLNEFFCLLHSVVVKTHVLMLMITAGAGRCVHSD